MTDATTLDRLAAMISARRQATSDSSYTRQLLDGGSERCAKKFGEEAVETVIAGVGNDAAALVNEAADTFYHLLVLLECHSVPLSRVMAELERRMGTSGIAEKAARPRGTP